MLQLGGVMVDTKTTIVCQPSRPHGWLTHSIGPWLMNATQTGVCACSFFTNNEKMIASNDSVENRSTFLPRPSPVFGCRGKRRLKSAGVSVPTKSNGENNTARSTNRGWASGSTLGMPTLSPASASVSLHSNLLKL